MGGKKMAKVASLLVLSGLARLYQTYTVQFLWTKRYGENGTFRRQWIRNTYPAGVSFYEVAYKSIVDSNPTKGR